MIRTYVHDIIRLPHEVRVDQDHEAMLHDIIIAKLLENMYWIVYNDRKHKKTLGSRRSLATVFWSLSTAASDT